MTLLETAGACQELMEECKLCSTEHVDVTLRVSEEMKRDIKKCWEAALGNGMNCDGCSWNDVKILGVSVCGQKEVVDLFAKGKPEDDGCWSWNEAPDGDWTHGTFDTREEAVEDARKYVRNLQRNEPSVVYIGRCGMVPLRTDLDVDHILEYLDGLYSDDSGCDYYIYDGVSDADREWLEQKLSGIMEEFHRRAGIKPNWFRVLSTEQYHILG